MNTVYRIAGRDPHLKVVGTIQRVLHTQTHTGLLGNAFPVSLVRCDCGDRWVLRLRGRWVLFEEASPQLRYDR